MNKYLIVFLFTLSAFQSCQDSQGKKPVYHPHKLESVPYSESVLIDGMLYISGQIGNDANDYNKIVEGGLKSQVRQAMNNIKNILKKYDATMDDIVKCTCILASGDDWEAMSEEDVKFFEKHKPARTTFGGAELGEGILVEIDCIAKISNN